MSKPGASHSSGISSGDDLKLPERHPACRRREAQPGSCTERENLAGDAKGKGASGDHREAENTDAPERGGLPRSSDESPVMGLERRGRVTVSDIGPTGCAGRSPIVQWKAAAFVRWHEPYDARVSRTVLWGARGEIPRAYPAENRIGRRCNSGPFRPANCRFGPHVRNRRVGPGNFTPSPSQIRT